MTESVTVTGSSQWSLRWKPFQRFLSDVESSRLAWGLGVGTQWELAWEFAWELSGPGQFFRNHLPGE